MMLKQLSFLLLIYISCVMAQDKDAFSVDNDGKKILFFDPSRLSVHNSISFGASSTGGKSSLQSQSLYTTMMQYQFAAPVTLNLNFSLPLHSTYSSMSNLSSSNLQSMEYFKSIPVEMSVSWQPTKNTSVHFSLYKSGTNNMMQYGNTSLFRPFHHRY